MQMNFSGSRIVNMVVNGQSVLVPEGADVSIRNGTVYVNGVAWSGGNLQGTNHRFAIEGGLINLTIDCGSVMVNGNVTGNVDAGGSVSCGDIGGAIESGGSVNCRDVKGNVDAGGSVNCGNIGGSVNCGNIGGSVNAGGSVHHG